MTNTAATIEAQYAGQYVTCGASWMGRRVRVLDGAQSGRVGTVIKVNKRSIRVALDPRPGSDFVETMIGHAMYFEAVAS